MKIVSKNKNSISPVIIETNDGKRFEADGELIKGGYSAYKESLRLVVNNDTILELNEEERERYTLQIINEVEKEKFPTKFELY